MLKNPATFFLSLHSILPCMTSMELEPLKFQNSHCSCIPEQRKAKSALSALSPLEASAPEVSLKLFLCTVAIQSHVLT